LLLLLSSSFPAHVDGSVCTFSHVCVCVCVCVCAYACVRVRTGVCVRACMPPRCERAQKFRFSPPSFPVQIQVIEDDRAKTTEPFTTGVRGQAPPLVTSKFLVKDQGSYPPLTPGIPCVQQWCGVLGLNNPSKYIIPNAVWPSSAISKSHRLQFFLFYLGSDVQM